VAKVKIEKKGGIQQRKWLNGTKKFAH
jgi:hypothetical protein